jgi:hypothetical protein
VIASLDPQVDPFSHFMFSFFMVLAIVVSTLVHSNTLIPSLVIVSEMLHKMIPSKSEILD